MSEHPTSKTEALYHVLRDIDACISGHGGDFVFRDIDALLFKAAQIYRAPDEPPEPRHPMLDVMLICDAYESGIGQGLKRREFKNPYDPVNDPHAYRAYGNGYDEGVKRSSHVPPDGYQWISVQHSLPPDGTPCLYWFNGKWWPGKYHGCNNEDSLPVFGGPFGFLTGDVTHWMVPGPPPTKDDANARK